MPKTHANYAEDFRKQAVDLLLSSGRSLKSVAAELGVSPNSLRNWHVRVVVQAQIAAVEPHALVGTQPTTRIFHLFFPVRGSGRIASTKMIRWIIYYAQMFDLRRPWHQASERPERILGHRHTHASSSRRNRKISFPQQVNTHPCFRVFHEATPQQLTLHHSKAA